MKNSKVTTLERAYRKKKRAAGHPQYIIHVTSIPDDLDAYCEARNISRSEYASELIQRDAERRRNISLRALENALMLTDDERWWVGRCAALLGVTVPDVIRAAVVGATFSGATERDPDVSTLCQLALNIRSHCPDRAGDIAPVHSLLAREMDAHVARLQILEGRLAERAEVIR